MLLPRRELQKDMQAAVAEYRYYVQDSVDVDDEKECFVEEVSIGEEEPASEKVELSPLELLCQRLARHQAEVETRGLDAGGPFVKLQRGFLFHHGDQLCRAVRECLQSPVVVKPTMLSHEVQCRFLEAQQTLQGTMRPAFHGTSSANFASIFRRGLLVPGQGNELRVVHGAVHGQGIYTANAESPELSWGFCTDQRMLICGVIDDATSCEQYALNRQVVSAESASIRHVGRAIVVFDDRRVAPLFEVVRGAEAAKKELPVPHFDWARHARVLLRVLGDCASAGGRTNSVSRRKLDRPSKRGRPNRHDIDLCRRRWVAKVGCSVPLCPRRKAWKTLAIEGR